MDLERFDGELTQLDMREGTIHRLHLRGRDGRRLVITIDPPEEDMEPIGARYSGPYAMFAQRTRPQVTITEEWDR